MVDRLAVAVGVDRVAAVKGEMGGGWVAVAMAARLLNCNQMWSRTCQGGRAKSVYRLDTGSAECTFRCTLGSAQRKLRCTGYRTLATPCFRDICWAEAVKARGRRR